MKIKKLSALLLATTLIFTFSSTALATKKDDYVQEQIKKQEIIKKSTGYTVKPTYPSALDLSNFHFEAKPGEAISSEVYVKNFGDLPRSFSFYGVDGDTNKEGNFVAKLRDDEHKSIGAWTTFETPEVVLDSKEFSNLKFTIQLPEDIKPGEYVGAIVMENAPPDKPGSITVSTRIAIKTRITVRDNPLLIPRMAHRYYIPVVNFWTTSFPKAYFWISSGLLVLSVLLLVASQRKRKKKSSKK